MVHRRVIRLVNAAPSTKTWKQRELQRIDRPSIAAHMEEIKLLGKLREKEENIVQLIDYDIQVEDRRIYVVRLNILTFTQLYLTSPL